MDHADELVTVSRSLFERYAKFFFANHEERTVQSIGTDCSDLSTSETIEIQTDEVSSDPSSFFELVDINPYLAELATSTVVVATPVADEDITIIGVTPAVSTPPGIDEADGAPPSESQSGLRVKLRLPTQERADSTTTTTNNNRPVTQSSITIEPATDDRCERKILRGKRQQAAERSPRLTQMLKEPIVLAKSDDNQSGASTPNKRACPDSEEALEEFLREVTPLKDRLVLENNLLKEELARKVLELLGVSRH